MDEGDDRAEVSSGQRKCRHALVHTTGAKKRRELIAAHVLRDNGRARQVGSRLTAHRVAAMTEPALRGEQPLPCRNLIGRIRLHRRRAWRWYRRGAGLAAALRLQEG